jgi:hypothetical protein
MFLPIKQTIFSWFPASQIVTVASRFADASQLVTTHVTQVATQVVIQLAVALASAIAELEAALTAAIAASVTRTLSSVSATESLLVVGCS